MASFVAGLIQLVLAPFADLVASKIPRVALLSGLSGLGIVYLSLRFCSEVRLLRAPPCFSSMCAPCGGPRYRTTLLLVTNGQCKPFAGV